jgi:hypothetical protein
MTAVRVSQSEAEIYAARSASEHILSRFQSDVAGIGTGAQHGLTGLVTDEMLADLRKAIDLLERYR